MDVRFAEPYGFPMHRSMAWRFPLAAVAAAAIAGLVAALVLAVATGSAALAMVGTFVGALVGIWVGALPALILGTSLWLLGLRWPPAASVWVWIAVGAVCGPILIGLPLHGPALWPIVDGSLKSLTLGIAAGVTASWMFRTMMIVTAPRESYYI
ncbi:hypothetical protein [Sphingomonas sp.]|jgi:hypothetical protein|uniref:hypothetical protein n=1 Tax=Sphingomonas sp. TaxID=28214 RepID=UPI002ED804D5